MGTIIYCCNFCGEEGVPISISELQGDILYQCRYCDNFFCLRCYYEDDAVCHCCYSDHVNDFLYDPDDFEDEY